MKLNTFKLMCACTICHADDYTWMYYYVSLYTLREHLSLTAPVALYVYVTLTYFMLYITGV